MPASKRRINSTGRKRIMHENVDIRLEPMVPDKPLAAGATISLEGHDFPAGAAVVLEAYQRSTGMRFDCGTVGNLNVPKVLYLNEIDGDETVLFRIKVIDRDNGTGKILGLANRIRPAGSDDLEGRRSIFPIKEMELGSEVWCVRVDEAGPVLCLNFRIPGFKHRILESVLLQGAILPAAFRIVLEKLAHDPVAEEEDDDDWHNAWLRYLRERLGIDDDVALMSEDEKQEWINSTVRRFCEMHEFVEGIRNMNEGGAS